MCGRFAFFVPIEQLTEEYALGLVPALEPRYNVAPTQDAVAVRQDDDGVRHAALLHWGLVPHWAKDPTIGNRMINARGETVADKPAYRQAFRRRRCIIPASGFYEWGPSDAGKWPRFFRAKDGPLLSLAGLWERWGSEDAGPLETFTIVTVAANAAVAPIHQRMPLCLPRSAYAAWLDPATPDEACLRLLEGGDFPTLDIYPVSKSVNNPRNDDPRLLDEVPIPAC